ncbi:Flagellar motor switch protein FliN [Buchnera aphidicola (Cinara laricifoliae)]|uniref:Flagellar motor switch protein FliN n=1 Tax=Buchnera aphidicola (Cinara laricifoliae) TaxID=2518977 RepID=A0A451DAV8_9GAMM|nr:Flagellar motor switch protein FliN [Buchnera aphidicola (Cinara laricifoliae)]
MNKKEVIHQETQNKNSDENIVDNSMLNNLSVMSVPVSITIELGKNKITIYELLQLSHGSILELEDTVDKPLNIFVNNCLIALGELVVHNEKYGVRIVKLLHK